MSESPDNIVPITPDARSAAEKFSAEHDRELLTILFTDLVDSTKLQSDLGNVEAARLTELHRRLVRDELAKYDAREIEWAGDSCVAVFTRPSEAVTFALCMQSEHRRARMDEPRLPLVRAGMHLGEIVVKKGEKKDDLFGLQVSEAARVMSLAQGNQIFCTRAVFDNAKGALKGSKLEGMGDLVWMNYGPYILQGSEEPVEICEVGSVDVALLKLPKANDKARPVAGDAAGSSTQGPSASAPSSAWKTPVVAAAGIMVGALVVGTLAVGYLARDAELVREPGARSEATPAIELIPEETKRLSRTSIVLAAHQPIVAATTAEQHLEVSPDGERVAYVADVGGAHRIVVREMDRREATELPGTEDAVGIFFSPDGASIGFMNETGIHYTSVHGGGAHLIASTAPVFGAVWLEDGSIVFGGLGSLRRVSSAGGEIENLTELDPAKGELAHAHPSSLPGQRRLLYSRLSGTTSQESVLAVYDLDRRESKDVMQGVTYPRYASSGHIVFSREGALMAVPFDAETLETTGLPLPVTEPGMSDSVHLVRDFAFSADGDLFYAPTGGAGANERRLVWADRQGGIEYLKTPPMPYESVSLSPDGTRIAFDFGFSGDVWIYDLESNAPMRALTTGGSFEHTPAWSPDGRRVAYSGMLDTGWDLFSRAADGSDTPKRLTFDSAFKVPNDWAREGDELIYAMIGPTSSFDLHVQSFGEEGTSRPLAETENIEAEGSISPDGKWFAYVTSELGSPQVMVKSYPDMGGGWRVSGDAGIHPRWSATTNELFYRDHQKLMAVRYEGEQAFEVVEIEEMTFDLRFFDAGRPWTYDVSPNGERFLLIEEPELEAATAGIEIAVVNNWFEVLRSIGSVERASP